MSLLGLSETNTIGYEHMNLLCFHTGYSKPKPSPKHAGVDDAIWPLHPPAVA
jgi:hypothetical protein